MLGQKKTKIIFLLLGAKTHVVTAVRCMLSAVPKSICSKYFINTSTAFDACMRETRIGSPVAFVVQLIILLCFFPRLLTAVSRASAGYRLLGMSVTLL